MKKICCVFFLLLILWLSGCNIADGIEKPSGELNVDSTVIEDYDSFSAYSMAIAELLKEYGITDAENLSGDEQKADSMFQTRRVLIITNGEIADTMGAVRILHYANEYVLQFQTEEEAKTAYESMQDLGIYQDVSPDLLLDPADLES